MKRLGCSRHSEGQAIVLFALVLVVLVAFVGLGIDGSNAFAQRRNANVAADAAAMAGARALLDANLTSSHDYNQNVYDAIDAYMDNHLTGGGSLSVIDWKAYYIGQNGQAVGSAIVRNTTSAPNIDIYSSSASSIRGISIDLHYTFTTYFMQIMGQRTLNVQAYGLAFVGPLGGASGADIVPLAIRLFWASKWSREPAGTRWDIDMFNSTPSLSSSNDNGLLPRPLIGTVDLRQMTLKPGGSAPTLGSASSCGSYNVNSPEDNLSYWWCKGSPHRVVSNINQQTIGMPVSSSLRAAVQWHIDNSPIVLFPVYENEGPPSSSLKNIRGFIAIKLINISGTRVEGELVNFYSAPGPITGNTSGYFGTYAINLVQ
jgi:Flp pilus assembly protein TadG